MKAAVQPLWWFSVVCLLCSVALAAKKDPVHDLPVGTSVSSESAACLENLRFVPSVEQKKAVESLFSQLEERHITIKPSLYKLLASADRDQLLSLCNKTALFFSHVDNRRVKNSGCLSSMIRGNKYIGDFIAQEDASIAMLAASPSLSSVTGMCSNRGIPNGERVLNLFSSPCWLINNQFSSELVRSFSSMLHSKGLPQENEVKDCLLYTSPSPRDRQKSRMPSSA